MLRFVKAIFLTLWLAAISSVLTVSAAFSGENQGDVVHLGISNYATPTPHEVLYTKTIETLRKVVEPRQLDVRYYSPGELSEAVQRDELDFVFGSAGFYRRTALKTGNRELVSIMTNEYPDPNHTDGAAIVVRTDRTDLSSIESLRNKELTANRPFTFTGFLVPMGAIAATGVDPETYFSKISFKGEGDTMQKIAEDVIAGRTDVGFLRLCMLETLIEQGKIEPGALRVINETTQPGEKCRRSTPLYPGWTISTTPKVASELSREATLALLSQPSVGNGLRWGIATNYQSVDDLYRLLRLGPYEYLRKWTVERFVQQYWAWLVAIFFAAVSLSVFAVAQNLKLKQSIKREKALETQSRLAAEKMDAMQKLWIVGQLSSTIAHELRQPLASIACLSRGLMFFFDRGEVNWDKTKEAIETIESQAVRANGIVEKVRSYAKTPAGLRERISLKTCVENAIKAIRSAGRDPHGALLIRLLDPVVVLADKVELELVAVNLIKNALDAVAQVPTPRVTISVSAGDQVALFVVTDNGPEISEEDFSRLTQPFQTNKPNGLGLGLSIVYTIVERHGGRLAFCRGSHGRGLSVSVSIPLEGSVGER